MRWDALPTELIYYTVRFLHRPRDVNALARVNQRFYAILDPVLYKCNVESLSSHILQWATKKNSLETAKKALQYGAQPNEFKLGEECALQFAVVHGRLSIVKLLLDRGALIRDPMILATAASLGLDEIAELLLDHGASPNAACWGQTPLMFAAEKGNEGAFTLLLQRGADPFANDPIGQSTVYYAVGGGSTRILATLLDLGLDMYQYLFSTRTAHQIRAARLGRLDAVKLFNERGVDVNFTNVHGCTALWEAASAGHLEVVQYLLKQGALLEIRDNWGNTPALHAAIKGRTSIVETLLDHGADLESADGNGRTILSWAAGQGHEDITQLLLARGARIEAMDKEGRTPLLLAADTNRVKTVKMLIDKGANVNHTDGISSPLSLAAGRGNSQMVSLLLKAGASTEFTTPKKQTPLFLAAMSEGASAVDTVRALLDYKANIEATDEDGKTALHYTLREDGGLLYLLSSRGANLDARDNLGRNLLMYASISGHIGHIDALIKMGLKVNDQDGDGMTALHHAVMFQVVGSMLPLLRGGADPEVRNEEGLSVYELARLNGNDDLLMEAERKLESMRI